MSKTACRIWALQAGLILLLCAPLANANPAVSADLVAKRLDLPGLVPVEGPAMLVYVAGPNHAVLPQLRATAAHIEYTQYTDSGYEAQASDVPLPGGPKTYSVNTLRALNQANKPTPIQHATSDATLEATATLPAYVLNIFADRPITTRWQMTDGSLQTIAQPQMDAYGIRGHDATNPAPPILPMQSSSGRDPYWTNPALGGLQLLAQSPKVAGLALHGTFTVEVVGLDFHLAGHDGDWTLQSGTWRDPIAPGSPGAANQAAHKMTSSFLRINVTDGDLLFNTLELGSFSAALPETNAVTGTIAAQDATGSLHEADGTQTRLTGSAYTLDGHYRLDANPSQAGVQVTLQGLDENGQPLAPASQAVAVPAIFLAALWAAFGVLALGLMATFAFGRHLYQVPTMEDVEAHLEAGQYRIAAREAKRLLRRRPDSEDALISRAVALTKGGRPGQVVREVRARLGRRDASDGVLHYLLGLAYLELGRATAGHSALSEAVRRTPTLASQVAVHLGQPIPAAATKVVLTAPTSSISGQQPSNGHSKSKEASQSEGYA